MSEKKFDRFGQYLILDHLLDGGMAKISRARVLGEQADKIVAIKMVQEKYSKDESFKSMFLDEIKTTFGLIHPNIVQTYNSGVHKNQLFVAMEYCDGRNLKEYIEKLKSNKYVFPIEISAFVIIQAAQGLHYAHTFTDKLTGKPLEIIHRDISPHNIMLNFDGSVKVIDFGIAKSETNSDATQAGTIKGKLSYLAPEYLEQKKLDPRYDLFALGITLWEMLCSKKLFKASNDFAVFKKIQECKVPKPSSISPNVPEELDKIVLKALAKDRDQRYKSCEEFARDLNKFLYSHFPEFNPSDLSYFAKELFKEEIKSDRDKLYEYGKIDISSYKEDYRKELQGESSTSSSSDGDITLDSVSSTPKKNRITEKSDGTRINQTRGGNEIEFAELKNAKSKKSKTAEIEIGLERRGSPRATKKMSGETRLQTVKSSLPKKSTHRTTISKSSRVGGSTRTHTRAKTNTKISTGRGHGSLVKIAAIAVFLFVGGFFVKNKYINKVPELVKKAEKVIDNEMKGDTTVKTETTVRGPSSKEVSLKLKNINRRRTKVYVNGVLKNISVLNTVKVNIGESLTIRVERPGREHYVVTNYVATEDSTVIEVRETPYASFGYLITSRPCFKGKAYFELYGESRVERLPIKYKRGIPFPAETKDSGEVQAAEHEIYIEREGLDLKRGIKFKVSDKSIVDLCKLIN